MQLIVAIITNTPVWVWAIVAFLVYRGWTMTRDRIVHPFTLMLIPGIFVALDVFKLVYYRADAHTLLLTFSGVLLGISTVLVLRPARTTVATQDGKLAIKGEWMSLCIFITIFAGNYATAVLTAMHLPSAADVAIASTLLNGFCVSFMATRTLTHLRVGQRAAPALLASER